MNDLMTRSFLNYVELKKQALKDEQASLKTGESLNPEDEQNLSSFYQEVDEIKTQITEIATLLQDLQSLNEEAKSAMTFNFLNALRAQLDSKTTSTTRKVISLKSRLETLGKSNVQNRQISAQFGKGTVVDRTRVAITNGLRARFREMMADFASIRGELAVDRKEDPLNTEIDDKVCVLDVVETMKKRGDSDLEVKNRNEAAMDIKRSLDRLQQVFLDMAVLVEEQQDQIDDIEKNMESSGMCINGGTNSLHYAKQTKKKGRKTVYWVLGIVLIILLVCLVAGFSS